MHIDYYLFISTLIAWIAIEAWLIFRDRRIEPTGGINGGIFSYLLLITPFTICMVLHFSSLQFALINLPYGLLIAIAVIWAGLGLRFWSIITLGRYFRTVVTIQDGQRVIDLGPYEYIRHPCYLGSIIIFAGIGLGFGNWIGFAAMFVIPFITFILRMYVEEKVMTSSFGNEYLNYMNRTHKLIPFLY